MRTEQRIFRDGSWDREASLTNATVVFAFGSGVGFDPAPLQQLRATYRRAHVVGCTTAGEIAGGKVQDGTLVCSAIEFENSNVEVSSAVLVPGAAELTGFQLADRLPRPGLRHLFVVSNGIGVNGAALMRGLRELIPPEVGITGGLAADGRLEHTSVALDDLMSATTVAAVGFYGDRLRVRCGGGSGFRPFGPERRISKSQGHVLAELDGEPALQLYRRYLGPHALPLRLPLSLPDGTLRTVVGVDEAQGTVTLAGDVPQGSYVRLMRASLPTLLDSAHASATHAPRSLSLVVSCVGRRLSLKQRTEEELDALRAEDQVMAGFYGLGALDNHTLNVTTLGED